MNGQQKRLTVSFLYKLIRLIHYEDVGVIHYKNAQKHVFQGGSSEALPSITVKYT